MSTARHCIVAGLALVLIAAASASADEAAAKPAAMNLADLEQLALEHNPTLAQAAAQVEAARGRAVQAGLYPNPTVG